MAIGVWTGDLKTAPLTRAEASPARPEMLSIKSDGRRLSLCATSKAYRYHDLLLRKEGERELLVGADKGAVALPAKPGDALELFVRFSSTAKASRGLLETYRARIQCPPAGPAVTLAELGATFERYHRPL